MGATPATETDLVELTGACPDGSIKSLTTQIINGAAWSIAGRMGSMGSLFLMNIVLARYLEKVQYSAFLAAASMMPFLAMLATVGSPFTIVRALRWQIPGAGDRAAILRGALVFTLMGSAATAIGFWLASMMFPEEPKWYVLKHHPGLMIAWFALSALCIVSASFLQGIGDFRTAAFIGARNGGLIPNCLVTIAVAIAAWGGALTLTLLMSFHVIGYLIAICFAALVVPPLLSRTMPSRNGPLPHAKDATADFSASWLFAESWPNLINQVIAVILIEMDLFWVTCLAPEETVADYGVVRNLRLLVTAPLLIASVSLAPFVAELYGKRDLKRLERMLRGSATLIAGPSLAALAILLVMPDTVIRWTFGADFVQAARALSIAAVGCIIFVISGSNGLVLTMTGKHRDLMFCSLFSLGLYLAISPSLIANYGVEGAAAAFTIQTAVQNIIVTLRVKRTTGVWTIPLCSISAVRNEALQLRRRFKLKK